MLYIKIRSSNKKLTLKQKIINPRIKEISSDKTSKRYKYNVNAEYKIESKKCSKCMEEIGSNFTRRMKRV